MKKRQAQVASLARAIRGAHQVLPSCQMDLDCPPDFGLERSILTPESIEALYALVRGDPSSFRAENPKGRDLSTSEQTLSDLLADMAQAQGPLSAWLEKPGGEAIATVCMDYARGRCRALYEITADELLMESLGDARGRIEALRGLVELASPFLGWDETRLRGSEHQVLRTCATLGLGNGAASPLLDELGDIPWAQVVATNDGWRVTALTVVQGLPLAALAGLEEYAAAYRVADAKTLHAEADWTDLPDPAEDVARADSPFLPDGVLAEGVPPSSWVSHQSEEANDDRRECVSVDTEPL